MRSRNVYFLGILALAAVSGLMALFIISGEVLSARPVPVIGNGYRLGGLGLGVILLAYGLIVLLLRKAGILGPRRTEGR